MVKLKGINVIFNKGTENEKIALDKISLTINEGDLWTIVGSNGAGKSTMLKVYSWRSFFPIQEFT